jgi:hypothetical protein
MSDNEVFEVPSPDLGASISRNTVLPMTEQDSDEKDENESEDSSDDKLQQKKLRTCKKDNREVICCSIQQGSA